MSDALASSVPKVKPEGIRPMTREEYDQILASIESVRKTLQELRDKRGVHPADLPSEKR